MNAYSKESEIILKTPTIVPIDLSFQIQMLKHTFWILTDNKSNNMCPQLREKKSR